jgi:sugar-specific transcriptional regulator TrmB
MIQDVLEDMGITHAESRVYLELLQNGQSKSGDIIKLTKLQSSTVYNSLTGLIKKGLVSYVLVGNVKEYTAQHPESFLTFQKEKEKRFLDILPELKKMEKNPERVRGAKVFEGIKGLRAAFDDILATMKKDEHYCFFQVYNHQIQQKKVGDFFRNYHSKRSGLGINVRGLAPIESKEAMRTIYEFPNTKIKYVKEFLPTGLTIYKDKVITIDWEGKEPIAITIQSKAVADSYRRFFDLKWKEAKKS